MKLNGTNCGDSHVMRDTNFKYCNIVVNKKIEDFDMNPVYMYLSLYGNAGICSPMPPFIEF
jgi:hypothetical protein